MALAGSLEGNDGAETEAEKETEVLRFRFGFDVGLSETLELRRSIL